MLFLCNAPLGIDVVSTMGSGPFPETEFDAFLRRLGVEPYTVGGGTEILVLGEEQWSAETLNNLLSERAGKTLRVYSQEMFLTFVLSGADPLDEDEDLLRGFGEGHPALEHLSSAGFHWPITTVVGEEEASLIMNGLQKVT